MTLSTLSMQSRPGCAHSSNYWTKEWKPTREVGTPIDHFIYRKAALKRPTSLREPMLRAFKQTGTALGLDVSLLGMSAEEIEALQERKQPDATEGESSPTECRQLPRVLVRGSCSNTPQPEGN